MIDMGKLSVTDQWTDGVWEVCRTRQNVSLIKIYQASKYASQRNANESSNKKTWCKGLCVGFYLTSVTV